MLIRFTKVTFGSTGIIEFGFSGSEAKIFNKELSQ